MVFAVDRILDVERRIDLAAQPLAIVDGETPVRIFGHDLQRRAVLGEDLHPHQPVAEIVGDRRDMAAMRVSRPVSLM